MAFRGLKTLTAIHTALFLLIAMGLVDFILVILHQEALIDAQVDKGRIFIQTLISQGVADSGVPRLSMDPETRKKLDVLIQRSGFDCAVLIDSDTDSNYLGSKPCSKHIAMERAARAALASGNETVSPYGVTWGVFWRQKKGVVVSIPLLSGARVWGVGSVALPLEDVYARLRRSQRFVLIYMLINALLLTGIWFYRLSRTYFDPVRKLAAKAETYSEEEDSPFIIDRQEDIIGQLSQSLNVMLDRISENKEKLKSTIASLKKANEDLKKAQQEIIRAEKFASVGRLASGIAHEIGNPLGIIGGYLELLKGKENCEDEKNEYVVRAIREVDRINSIIQQLLDFSRSSEKKAVPFSVHAVIDDMVKMLKPQPLLSGIKIEVTLSARSDHVFGDPDQMRQVLLNLVINAADAVASMTEPSHHRIFISTRNDSPEPNEAESADRIRIAVRDDGPGIAEEHLENIFDPFFTTKAPGQGTGLGLWVSYLIVEGMGGRIQADSHLGKGTTLEIHVPLYHEKKQGNRDPVLISGKASGEGGRDS